MQTRLGTGFESSACTPPRNVRGVHTDGMPLSSGAGVRRSGRHVDGSESEGGASMSTSPSPVLLRKQTARHSASLNRAAGVTKGLVDSATSSPASKRSSSSSPRGGGGGKRAKKTASALQGGTDAGDGARLAPVQEREEQGEYDADETVDVHAMESMELVPAPRLGPRRGSAAAPAGARTAEGQGSGMAGAVDVELSPGPEPSGSESEPEGFAIDLPIKKLDVAHAAKVSCFIVDEGIRDECCAAPAPA